MENSCPYARIEGQSQQEMEVRKAWETVSRNNLILYQDQMTIQENLTGVLIEIRGLYELFRL